MKLDAGPQPGNRVKHRVFFFFLTGAECEHEKVICHNMKRFQLFLFCALHRQNARLLWKWKYIKPCMSDNTELYCHL